MSLKAVLAFVLLFLLTACAETRIEFHDGKSSALSDYRGKWLLINYWASWCKPCIEEIPELNHVNANADIQVIGYNFDRLNGEALSAEAETLHINFPLMLSAPGPLFEQARPQALPATMLIDPNGEFKTWLMGPQTQESIKAKIDLNH